LGCCPRHRLIEFVQGYGNRFRTLAGGTVQAFKQPTESRDIRFRHYFKIHHWNIQQISWLEFPQTPAINPLLLLAQPLHYPAIQAGD
jgi:hypothetical protein